MATIYTNSQIRPTDTNQDVGGFIRMTCILDEGGFTVNAAESVLTDAGVLNAGYNYTWTTSASKLSKYSPITLKVDNACTYSACEGRPVVCTPATTDGIFGYVLTEPKAMTALTQLSSTAAADTLSERLAGRYYRYAQVVLFCNMAEAKKVDNSAVVVGSNLEYDISDADYLHDADGDGMACVSAHKGGTAGDYVLGLHGVHKVITGA